MVEGMLEGHHVSRLLGVGRLHVGQSEFERELHHAEKGRFVLGVDACGEGERRQYA